MSISEKTLLNLFGIENPEKQYIQSWDGDEDLLDLEASKISVETFRLIVESLWEKIQDGITLAEIENLLFVMIFCRFVLLIMKYNLKTSFIITMIGLVAGWFWYTHLSYLIGNYRLMLIDIPFLNNLGVELSEYASIKKDLLLNDLRLEKDLDDEWYNPGKVIIDSFPKTIIHMNHYIDPISMIVSNLPETTQDKILPMYYAIYNKAIPNIYKICSKTLTQFGPLAFYLFITRFGRRFCPYLIRWHWTFLILLKLIEKGVISFAKRVYSFQSNVLIPQFEEFEELKDLDLDYEPFLQEQAEILQQIKILDNLLAVILVCHIGFVLFGLFHAIWGQYFYIPFFVENTELHVGSRSKTSIYSMGQTPWQEEDLNSKNLASKFWYVWFGRITRLNSVGNFNKSLKKILKKLKKFFKKFRRKRKE